MDYTYLLELFETCLTADYRHTEGGGSFATLRDGELLYLFFEQSNGVADWYNNLSYRAVKDGDLFVHEGFLRVWKEILPLLEPLLHDRSVARVVSVGYSHGAALSLLCHRYLYEIRPDLRRYLETYAYGCPRVFYGSMAGAEKTFAALYRVTNRGDIVTRLPPSLFGYRHVGHQISVGKEGKYTAIDAHRPENYRKELEFLAHGGK